jgi:hypothetical protein
MLDKRNFLYRTNYYQREWTWIRRIIAMIFLGTGALLLPLQGDLQFLNFIVAGLVVIYFIAKPKDDLAVTDKLLLHIKRSTIKKFTRIDKYEISEIISIRCGGIHTDGWELMDFFNGGGNSGGYYNTVEMTFRNGESKSLQLAIDRKKLDTIVKIVYDLKRRT